MEHLLAGARANRSRSFRLWPSSCAGTDPATQRTCTRLCWTLIPFKLSRSSLSTNLSVYRVMASMTALDARTTSTVGPACSVQNLGTTLYRFVSTEQSGCFFEVHVISLEERRHLPRVILTDDSVPYDPTDRLHSRRRSTVPAAMILPWKQTLGFVPDHVVARTLDATTQLIPSVEAESREIMWDRFQTRLLELKVQCMHDVYYVGTFFLSIPSTRGYTCWNLFSYKHTGLDVVYLMCRRAQSPSTLTQLVSDCGASTTIKSDNAPEFKSKRWASFLETMCIPSEFTEAHHPSNGIIPTKTLPNVAVALSKLLLYIYYGLLVAPWCTGAMPWIMFAY